MNATFIDLPLDEQAAELRKFLHEQGSSIAVETSTGGQAADILEIIEATSNCWSSLNNEAEAEGVFHSIISLMLVLQDVDLAKAVKLFCEKVASQEKADRTSSVRLRIMLALHNGVESRAGFGYSTYFASLKLAKLADLLQYINTDVSQVKLWLQEWSADAGQCQVLWRLLHEAFLQVGQGENAMRAMLELLATHTEQSAAAAREDAHRCIVTSLKAPDTFLLDHLLSLKPVKFLEGSPIHDLLTIFVSGKYQDYAKFESANKDFINSIGLDSEAAQHKMKLLHFMSLAETRRDVEFKELQEELDLTEDNIEPFIIDLVRTRKVRARINQVTRRVTVQATTQRTFGRVQWQSLRDTLHSWRQQVQGIESELQRQMEAVMQA